MARGCRILRQEFTKILLGQFEASIASFGPGIRHLAALRDLRRVLLAGRTIRKAAFRIQVFCLLGFVAPNCLLPVDDGYWGFFGSGAFVAMNQYWYYARKLLHIELLEGIMRRMCLIVCFPEG